MYSDISPYSPNSNLDQAEQEVDTLKYGDAIRSVVTLGQMPPPGRRSKGSKGFYHMTSRLRVK